VPAGGGRGGHEECAAILFGPLPHSRGEQQLSVLSGGINFGRFDLEPLAAFGESGDEGEVYGRRRGRRVQQFPCVFERVDVAEVEYVAFVAELVVGPGQRVPARLSSAPWPTQKISFQPGQVAPVTNSADEPPPLPNECRHTD